MSLKADDCRYDLLKIAPIFLHYVDFLDLIHIIIIIIMICLMI